MFFNVIGQRKSPPVSARSKAFLYTDDWNDYAYYTQFYLTYVDAEGINHDIGTVKIAYFGQQKLSENKLIKEGNSFDALDNNYFSLGQDDNYYDRINKFGAEIRERILDGLRDIAKDEELYERAFNEDVTKVSLLRFVNHSTVTGQFRRIARGGNRLTNYEVYFNPPAPESNVENRPILDFFVVPDSTPPTNIHVLIGRNGIGKTHLINNMAKSLLNPEEKKVFGEFTTTLIPPEKNLFANLITVSFSAFDETEFTEERKDNSSGLHYSYIGLKHPAIDTEGGYVPKNNEKLNDEFVSSANNCMYGAKIELWQYVLGLLETDDNFKEADITSVINKAGDYKKFKKACSALYHGLSSGHKIVLLTITRLVESIEERSLVLMDEPETHLSPPLLSAFIRALSTLLTEKNGVAIIATHSPVILQEVPRSCVYKIRRVGYQAIYERLENECFGENVGALTREVFGLEVTDSGFHKNIKEAINRGLDYEDIIRMYNGQLGMEARAIIRGLIGSGKDSVSP